VPLLTGEEPGMTSSHPKANVDPDNPKNIARGQNKSRIIANSLLSRLAEAVGSFALVSDLRGTIKSAKGKTNAFVSSLSDKANPAAGLSPGPERASNSFGPRTIVRDDSAHWAVVNAPFSRFTEAMRSIKLAVDLNDVVKANRVIGFTSSLPNEGKSTVAVAVAQLMSQVGKRTIVVDCDLRNPSLSRALAPSANSGLLEVITEKASLEEVIWIEPSLNM
jgi:Mrp family chromosome partitioning ATPase